MRLKIWMLYALAIVFGIMVGILGLPWPLVLVIALMSGFTFSELDESIRRSEESHG